MTHENEIAVFARDAIGIDKRYDISVNPLDARGSDRVFYRVSWNDGTAIAIHYDVNRIENEYYPDIAVFLKKMRIPVPELLAHDPEKRIMILEDLGDADLFSYGRLAWPERQAIYQKTLGAAQRLHKITEKNFPSGSVRLMDGFNADLYLWEQDYFLVNFVKGCCDLTFDPQFDARLRSELAGLTDRLCKAPQCLIHRDLQSRNVMVREGNPYFIDFQGMRFGNPFYDLGSLLCDPYVSIPDEGREELLSFYYVLSSQEIEWDMFQKYFWDASVERLMQALGAYGFLGKVKGLAHFLEFIPAGLTNLNTAISHAPSLAALKDAVLLCQVSIG